MATRGRAVKENQTYGLDTCQVINDKNKQDFYDELVKKRGYRWIARYGPRWPGSTGCRIKSHPKGHYKCPVSSTLSLDESKLLRDELKLHILPVQFRPPNSAVLNKYYGTRQGKFFVQWAKCMGIPKGVHLWCDLEGKATQNGKGRQAQLNNCVTYVNAWAAEAVKAGYRAGLYISQSLPGGFASIHLAAMPLVTCFWKSATNVPKPPGGFSIIQSRQLYIYRGLKCRYNNNKIVRHRFVYDADDLKPSVWGNPWLWA